MSRIETFSRMYQTPEWFDQDQAEFVSSMFEYERLSLLNIFSMAGLLGVVERLGKMPSGELKIFEFGSGLGEGLVSLDMFAQSRGNSEVLGSERTSSDRRTAIQVSDLLPTVTGVDNDGFNALDDNPDAFHLIVAHMFGPSYFDTDLPAAFIPVAQRALHSDGVLVINSDEDTMENVQNWGSEFLAADQMLFIEPDSLPGGFIAMPHALISK